MIKEILKEISPSEDERKAMEATCKDLITRVKRESKELDREVKVSIFGSVSRGTWLAHEKDIDVFVMFPQSSTKKQLERTVTEVGRRILLNIEKRFAEHPYVKGEYDGYKVEIVPCYLVEDPSKRISAVDRTPFHDRFVKKNLKGRQGEVRLLKQFLLGIGCYGAEVKVEGFSGYLCELLIIKYGSFEKTLMTASTWSSSETTKINGKNKNTRFEFSTLIFTDPTDPERNVASALSKENLSLFIYASKEYLRLPRRSFFFPEKRIISKEALLGKFKQRSTHLLSLSFKTPDVIDDILYSQIKKTIKFLGKKLKESGFSIVNSGFFVEQSTTLVWELQFIELPSARLHLGPPVNSENEVDFLRKHRGSNLALTSPFIKKDRWAVFLKREHFNAEKLISAFLSAKDLKARGVPSHIASAIQRGHEIMIDEKAIKENSSFYANLFDPKFPWEA
jgi:tRNA nucleotidyltransferase (CCA-adding enzyme)